MIILALHPVFLHLADHKSRHLEQGRTVVAIQILAYMGRIFSSFENLSIQGVYGIKAQ